MKKSSILRLATILGLTLSSVTFAQVNSQQYLCEDENGTNCKPAPVAAAEAKTGDLIGIDENGRLTFIQNNTSGCALGSVHAFARAGFVTGDFIIADGRTVSATDYPEFVKAWTNDPNATEATVEDLRGEFIRGLDSGRGIDMNRTVGSYQSDDFKSHHHSLWSNNGGWDRVNGYGYQYGSRGVSGIWNGTGDERYFERDRNNTGSQLVSDTGGEETRPRNVAYIFAYCGR